MSNQYYYIVLSCPKNSTDASYFSLEKHYEDFLPEKIHSRFCKFILGVNKYAPILASKAELGRYLVVISALLHSIKYWLYLNENPFEKHSTFSYVSHIHKDGGAVSTFSHQICCLLKYFGFNHVWGNKTTLSLSKLLHALQKVMCSRYEQFFFASIKGTLHKDSSSNKLRSYCKFKVKR